MLRKERTIFLRKKYMLGNGRKKNIKNERKEKLPIYSIANRKGRRNQFFEIQIEKESRHRK